MCPYTSAHELHVMLSIGRTPGNATAEEIDPHTMLSNFARRKSPRRCSRAELLVAALLWLSPAADRRRQAKTELRRPDRRRPVAKDVCLERPLSRRRRSVATLGADGVTHAAVGRWRPAPPAVGERSSQETRLSYEKSGGSHIGKW